MHQNMLSIHQVFMYLITQALGAYHDFFEYRSSVKLAIVAERDKINLVFRLEDPNMITCKMFNILWHFRYCVSSS